MKVAVIKYNAGNIRSVDYALKRLGVEAVITSDKEVLKAADKVIFPGVGEAETTMLHLKESGMDRFIKELRQPVLGICLGMQLMCRFSEEGNVGCLGIFDTDVKRFVPRKHEDKVPHMGWNTIGQLKSDLFKGFTRDEFVYFVHSYYVPVSIRINDWEIIIEEAVLPFFSPIKYMPEQRMSGRDQRMIELPDFLQSDLLHYPFGASVG